MINLVKTEKLDICKIIFKKSIDVKISKELEQKFVEHKFWKWKSQLIKTHQKGSSTQKTKQKNAFQG